MNQNNTWFKFKSLVVLHQLHLSMMVTLPEINASWLTDFVTLSIQLIKHSKLK